MNDDLSPGAGFEFDESPYISEYMSNVKDFNEQPSKDEEDPSSLSLPQFAAKAIKLTDQHLEDWKNGRNPDLFENIFSL
jgi:hypothetical protein